MAGELSAAGAGGAGDVHDQETALGVLGRHDEAWAVGEQLLAGVRAGWLEALGSDVGVNRSAPLQ